MIRAGTNQKILMYMIFLLGGLAGLVSAGQIFVGTDQTVCSIQEAIQLANDGDTIFVHNGIYREHDLIINKKVFLLGENYPVIDGESQFHIITITSDGVRLNGFTIRNAGLSYINDNAGLKLDNVKDCVIENNRFENNFFALYLARSEKCIIRNNRIQASGTRETASGNGIHLWYCKNINIERNRISGHRDGIYLEFVEHSEIKGNLSESNLRYGLHFMFSNDCLYRANTFRYNGAGVAVMYTKRILMEYNRFEKNWGPASYGILLKDITDSRIRDNVFYQNSIGLYAEASNRIEVQKNKFLANGWAVKVMANSMDNRFSANDFIDNSFDVATNSRQNFNIFAGNYWSMYKGYDLDRDGIGDVPHRPVRLFSVIVEKQHPALILLKSFFIQFNLFFYGRS